MREPNDPVAPRRRTLIVLLFFKLVIVEDAKFGIAMEGLTVTARVWLNCRVENRACQTHLWDDSLLLVPRSPALGKYMSVLEVETESGHHILDTREGIPGAGNRVVDLPEPNEFKGSVRSILPHQSLVGLVD